MTIEEFRAAPSSSLAGPLLALWWDAHGNWDRAHEVAHDIDGPDGAWVHAYLHRKEGDLSNATYWYSRARRPVSKDSLEAEWERIVSKLLRRA